MEVNFSELINKNRATLALLDDNPSILLHRRDGEDLVLTTADRAQQDRTVVSTAIQFFVALMKNDATARSVVPDILPEVFPWVRFLPENAVGEFAMELVETARAADSIDDTAPISQLIVEWKSTAEVHANPELHRILTREYGEDAGPVPQPKLPEANS